METTLPQDDAPPLVRPLSTPLPDNLSAVATCRRWLRRHLDALDLPGTLAADLELVASELVANAFLHARAPRSLWLQVLPGPRVLVAVRDGDPRPPRPRSAGLTETRGRGLRVVAALADRWGTTPDPWGKAVWAELAVPTHDERGEHAGPRG
jgi:anti-sigma regulatory factor (Ser/Thr protein kinase)